jgi:hypothetical protein
MIIFEIFSDIPQVPNKEVTLYFEDFLIGSFKKCDLLLPKTSNSSVILKAKHTEKGLVLRSKGKDLFWLDGKKIQGSKLVQIGQMIQLGNCSFKIKDRDYSKVNRNADIEYQYEKFNLEKGQYHSILESIEKEILYADNNPLPPSSTTELNVKIDD